MQALTEGDPVDKRNARGQTPLLVAVWNDDLDAAPCCWPPGPMSTPRTRSRTAPISSAGAKGRVNILRLILDHGAALTSTNRFGGPVSQRIVKQLLAADADRSILDFNGTTPLEHAKVRGFTEIAEMLED